MRDHVLDKWLPRAVDGEHGGFNQFYREDWSHSYSLVRSVVYQSRMTWVAAKAAKRYAGRGTTYLDCTRHGTKCLREKLWDPVNGGFYWSIDDSKRPAPSKHAYGIAFGIYALAASYEVTQDSAALALAKEAFQWLEIHAHDPVNLGYFEALKPDGVPITGDVGAPDSLSFGQRPGTDAIGTPYGLKSMNTHIHLLEAFSELLGVWPDPNLELRLKEIFGLLMTRVLDPSGYLHLYFEPDWKVVPAEDSYGHDIETAYLLVEAAHAMGLGNEARTWATARSIVDHTLNVGWDKTHGGVFQEGSHIRGPSTASGSTKGWWEQAESLNALLLMHEQFGAQSDRYWNAFARQWDFIKNYQLDRVNGGWFSSVSREGVATSGLVKSDSWTDPYHQGRSLLNVTDRLRRLASASE